MNRLHRWYLQSDHWRRTVAQELIGWTLDGADLGDDLLELGAGAGAATRHLRSRARRVTSIDVELPALANLRDDAGGRTDNEATGSLRPVCSDATALPFGPAAFSAVAAFTMLHHVADPERQRMLLREARRVLRPGGVFVGCDARWSLALRLFHLGDVFAPVPPDRLASDLLAAGFDAVKVSTGGRYLRWRAHRAGN